MVFNFIYNCSLLIFCYACRTSFVVPSFGALPCALSDPASSRSPGVQVRGRLSFLWQTSTCVHFCKYSDEYQIEKTLLVVSVRIQWAGNTDNTPGESPSRPHALFTLGLLTWFGKIGSSKTGTLVIVVTLV